MAKKSLADQITDLYNSTPGSGAGGDFDIEDSERADLFQHQDNSGSGSDNDDSDDEALKAQHYVDVGKSKLRAEQGLQLKEAKYQGKSSSRKEIFGDDGSEREQEESDEEEDDNEEDESLEDSESEEASEKESSEFVQEDEEINGELDSEDQEQSDSEENEEDDSEEESNQPTTDKRAKLKQLMSNERKQILSRLSTSTQTDALKGYAVITQQETFDKIIDIRMKLQKAVANSNLLPLNNETFEEFAEEEDSGSSKAALETAEKLLHTALTNIINLRSKTDNNKKRTFAEYATETAELDNTLDKSRDSILTKWWHKVDSASGATALQGNKFKSLNSNAAQQVQMNLMDMDRLIKRTRLNRRDVRPLGYVDEQEDEDEEDEEQETKNNKHKMDRTLKEHPHIFNDEDFYRVLLNDLVDRKITTSNPTSNVSIQLIKPTKFKNKNVDTKASKGRKLHYAPQEKLINWDAPRGKLIWGDEMIDEFFAGLLGQRVDFNEDDEDLAESDDEVLKNDDLRIFG